MNMPIERHGRISSYPKRNIRHNLTGNKYGSYIPRQDLEDEIIDFLRNEKENYQVVSGFGGIGKSSLIYSVLSKIINGEIDVNKNIDSIIWVTDSYDPGDLDVDKLVDEINAVYGDSSSTRVFTGEKAEKRELAKNHLNLSCDMMSIIVVDNFETVTDDSFRRFIFELPQSCKVILTSKLKRDACIQTGIIKIQNAQCIRDLSIPPFTKPEWEDLFNSICSSVTRVNKWCSFFDGNKLDEIINLIYTELDGIPFLFERILIQISEKNVTNISKIQKLIQSIAKNSGGYERMISYSWNRLSQKSKAVLIAATLQGYLSTLNFIQLSSVSRLDIYEDERSAEIGSDLDEAVDQCLDVKLIDIDVSKGIAEHYIPSPVYRYVINKLLNDESIKEKYSDVIQNWIDYYKKLTQDIGMCFNNTEKMLVFDSVNQRDALDFLLDYCYRNEMFEDYVCISNNMRYFFYTRSIWDIGDRCVHIKRAKAANKCGDYLSELEAYVYYINIASKYRQLEGVSSYLHRVSEIIEIHKIQTAYPEVYFRYAHALGLYYYHKNEGQKALEVWGGILTPPINTHVIHDIDAATRWYAKCLVEYSTEYCDDVDLLVQKINELLKIAREHNFERAIIDYTLMLVKIYVKQQQKDALRHLLFDQELVALVEKTNDALYKVKYYLYCAYCSTGSEREDNIAKAKKISNVDAIKKVIQIDMMLLLDELGPILN